MTELAYMSRIFGGASPRRAGWRFGGVGVWGKALRSVAWAANGSNAALDQARKNHNGFAVLLPYKGF